MKKLVIPLIPTPGRRQSKMLILSTNVDKRIVRNRVFDCHLSPNWQSKTLFLVIFDPHLSIVKGVFNCRLPGVIPLAANV